MSVATEKTWNPDYDKWRHGGWYVGAVRYPSGACGCVSNNYDDKKWRIACGDHHHITFSSRDDAAKAEYVAVEMLKDRAAMLLAACKAVVDSWESGDLAAAARSCQAAISGYDIA